MKGMLDQMGKGYLKLTKSKTVDVERCGGNVCKDIGKGRY